MGCWRIMTARVLREPGTLIRRPPARCVVIIMSPIWSAAALRSSRRLTDCPGAPTGARIGRGELATPELSRRLTPPGLRDDVARGGRRRTAGRGYLRLSGDRRQGRRRRPREQPRLDQPADDVSGRNVKLLDQRG